MIKPIAIGRRVPFFVLKDQNGSDVRMSKLAGKRVLLSFHPLAWTKICSRQMKSLEKNQSVFDKLRTLALGLSVDTIPSKFAWARSLSIKKTQLLSDFWPHGQVAKRLGLFRAKQGFSERANVVIDEKGKVVFVKVYPIKELPDIKEIISFLKGAGTVKGDLDKLLVAAMESEVMAQKFYTKAAARAASDTGKEFFNELAAFEHFHYENVKKIIESRNKNRTLRLTGPKPRLREVTSEVKGEFEPNKDEIINVLGLAIRAEKEAQERYKRIARMMEDDEGREIFSGLAHDEFRHQRLLEDQLYQISNRGTIIWE